LPTVVVAQAEGSYR